MAETKKSPGRPKKEEAVEVDTVVTENDILKQQLEEMKKQMELMQQMLLMNQVNAGTAVPTKKKADRMIRFVNMVPGTLVLRGTVIWKIEGQFGYHDFLETEAAIIVNNMANLVRQGLVYITDAEFVDEHNLTEVYRYLLSDKQLKELFERDSKYVVEMYKMANDGQKKIIVDMIDQQRVDGKDVDANVLLQIGKLCGRNLLDDEDFKQDTENEKE